MASAPYAQLDGVRLSPDPGAPAAHQNARSATVNGGSAGDGSHGNQGAILAGQPPNHRASAGDSQAQDLSCPAGEVEGHGQRLAVSAVIGAVRFPRDGIVAPSTSASVQACTPDGLTSIPDINTGVQRRITAVIFGGAAAVHSAPISSPGSLAAEVHPPGVERRGLSDAPL